MKTKRNIKETGNVLLCVLGAILIVSLIGATVLRNSTTRLNASTNQVRGWKEALSAAETGGDIGFAELRKQMSTDSSVRASQWVGWTPSVTGFGYVSPQTTFGSSNLMAQTIVEKCYFKSQGPSLPPILTLWDPTDLTLPANPWYRLRSKGTAPLPNLKRTGMDDALIGDGLQHFAAFGSTAMQDITERGKGDSLLRKIDFNTDHFIATYGPLGDGVGKALVAVATPQIARRIEQIVTPVTPFFDAAIKCVGSFYGLGSASYIDSYNSNNPGGYDPSIKTNPASLYYSDSRHGNVEIDSATAAVKGSIYGDVATNGGNVTSGNPGIVYGTIDNNVPFTLDPYSMPATGDWVRPLGVFPQPGTLPSAVTFDIPLRPQVAGDRDHPTYYTVSSITAALTVNPTQVSGNDVDTYVAIHVTTGTGGGDITGTSAKITVNPKVHLKIYFDGNISAKAQNIVNNSTNAASNVYAGNLQFYGISPTTPGQTQTVILDAGGGQPTILATVYAPGADVQFKGAPNFIGSVVGKSFYANGNINWTYDRALNDDGQLLDFRIASYVEDTR
jgi:hypothetical protein